LPWHYRLRHTRYGCLDERKERVIVYVYFTSELADKALIKEGRREFRKMVVFNSLQIFDRNAGLNAYLLKAEPGLQTRCSDDASD